MLVTVLALLILAGACAVVLFGQRAEVDPVIFVATEDEASATSEAWRGAALDAHGRVRRLRQGISSALEVRDPRAREAMLRDAMADTWRPERIRLDL